MSAVIFVAQVTPNSVLCWQQRGCIYFRVFGELRYSLSKSVDVFESLGSVEGKSSRTHANNRAIAIMKGQHFLMVFAFDNAGLRWDV